MLKQRGIKAIIISLLVILSSTCFSLLFVNAYTSFSKQEEPQAVDLTITELQGLIDFAWEVRENNNNFQGKVVELKANIDCEGKNIQIGKNYDYERVITGSDGRPKVKHENRRKSFSGTFNGNGFTIYNINFETNNSFDTGDEENTEGLFVSNSGTIKNLKVKNYNMFISDGANNSRGGVIAGYNSGTIENCIVEDIRFISARSSSECKVGAIAGKSSGTVQNCLVTGKYEIGGDDDHGIFKDDGLYAAYFVAQEKEAKFCVFNATVDEIEAEGETYAPNEHDTALDEGKNNYSTADTAVTGLTANSQCSSVGGRSGTAWYHIAGYYTWPVLRAFESWGTKNIYTDNQNATKFEFPSELSNEVHSAIINNTDGRLNLLGTSINATISEGYYFSNWVTYENVNYFFEEFVEQYTINFASPTYDRTSINVTPSPASVTVSYGTSISVSGSTYTVGTTTVTYTLPSQYELYSKGLNTVATDGKVKDLGNNGATATVTPTVKLKTYTVTFTDLTHATESGSLTHTLAYGTVINATYTSSTCTYTSNGTTLVSYTRNDDSCAVLYELLGTGLTNDTTTITSNETITPDIQQTRIYLEFENAKIGTTSTSYSPSITTTQTIAYSSKDSGTGSISAVSGFNDRTITYLIGEVTCTYTVPVIYTLSDEGIEVVETTITVTPVISQENVKIQFLSTSLNGTTVTPSITYEMLIKYNSGAYLNSGIDGTYIANREGNSLLEFSFYKAGETELSYVYYTLAGNSVLTFKMDTTEGGSATSKITITPILMIKEYDIEFG